MCIVIDSLFHKQKETCHVCACVLTGNAYRATATLFFSPHTHSLWLCLAFCLPSTDSLSYSWPICLGKCCVRCVSKRTSSVSAVQLLIVSSSACQKCYYCPSNIPKDASFSLLSIVAYLNPQFNLVLASLFKNGPSDSPVF